MDFDPYSFVWKIYEQRIMHRNIEPEFLIGLELFSKVDFHLWVNYSLMTLRMTLKMVDFSRSHYDLSFEPLTIKIHPVVLEEYSGNQPAGQTDGRHDRNSTVKTAICPLDPLGSKWPKAPLVLLLLLLFFFFLYSSQMVSADLLQNYLMDFNG